MEKSSLQLEVQGMTCVRCGERVQRGLLDIEGVLKAEVDWEAGSANMEYEPEITSAEDILEAPVFSQERFVEGDGRVIHHKYTAAVRDQLKEVAG